MESLFVEFDQEKFEKFHSSGSASSKTMRQYRRVSLWTRSRISLEISPEVARTSTHSASRPLLTRFWKSLVQPTRPASTSLKRPAGLMHQHMIKAIMKINPTITLLSELYNFRLPRVPNNPCGSIKMVNVDVGIVLVNNRSKILQMQSVLQMQNMRFRHTFL